MKSLRFILPLWLLAAMLPAITSAQEADLVSYRQLMDKINDLEAQIQNQPRISTASYAGDQLQKGGCDCNDSCRRRGLYAFYENVIVQPYFSRNTAYFLEDPAPNNDGYREVAFDWEFKYSPRIELGYISDCGGLGVRTRYWHFDSDTSLYANDPNGDIFVGFAEDSIGDDIGIFGANEASFEHSVKMDVVDLEAAFRDCNWTYSFGVRYARMEQTYTGTELNVINPDRFVSGHNFDGWGLTGAAEVLQPWRGGFSVFAKSRGSLLYGQSGFSAANPDGDSLLENRNPADLLAVGELQVGLDWRRCLDSGNVVFVTFALEAQYWFNAGTGAPFNNAPFDEANYQNSRPQDDDMGFFGGNIGLGLLY